MENRSAKGCLRDKFDVRDFKLRKNIALAARFPEEYSCLHIPEVKDQGYVGSCVAHATAEILESHSGCKNKLSTNFIYGIHNKLYGSEGPGMYLREACKIAKDYGDPEYQFCPENTEVKEVYAIAEKAYKNIEARNNACQYRIKSYARLSTADEIKYALYHFGPVLISIVWYKDNKVVDGYLMQGENKEGGHAIMVYGYNESGFLCLNSWGKSWGAKGRFILPYTYKISEAFSLIPYDKDQSNIVKPSRGDFIDIIYKIINFFVNIFN